MTDEIEAIQDPSSASADSEFEQEEAVEQSEDPQTLDIDHLVENLTKADGADDIAAYLDEWESFENK